MSDFRLARLLAIAALLACLGLLVHNVFAQQTVPALTARVVDTTQTLSPQELERIESELAQIEQERGAQVVVLLVASTAPEDIASYANRVANDWKIGRREVGDGVLMVIATQDRKLRIEVAKALEGAIPDLAAKQIISNQLAPALKQGQYAQGISSALARIDQRIAAENLPATPKRSDASAGAGFHPNDYGFEWADFFIFLFFVVPLGGAVAKGIFGNKLGSLVTGGVVGGAAFYITASVLIAGLAFFAALIFTLISSMGRHISRGRGGRDGGYTPGYFPGADSGIGVGGWGDGGGSGGAGFGSGGGGDFGGGGASGDF